MTPRESARDYWLRLRQAVPMRGRVRLRLFSAAPKTWADDDAGYCHIGPKVVTIDVLLDGCESCVERWIRHEYAHALAGIPRGRSVDPHTDVWGVWLADIYRAMHGGNA